LRCGGCAGRMQQQRGGAHKRQLGTGNFHATSFCYIRLATCVHLIPGRAYLVTTQRVGARAVSGNYEAFFPLA
jgi:predicted metal-binding protein